MGMELVLVRHAKSLHEAYVQSDIERHLCERGYHDAADSANWLISSGVRPDILVSSPAIRAYSTALIFARFLSCSPASVQLHASIYEASLKELLYVIAEIKPEFRSVMLFGHNPGFTELINYLCGPLCQHLPTAGVAILHIPANPGELPVKGKSELKAMYSGHKAI